MTSKWRAENMPDLAFALLGEMRANTGEDAIAMQVVSMNFLAPAEVQWSFIVAAVDLAENEDELGYIAAGSFERLMGIHGEAYIDRVEERCAVDPKFTQMVRGAWQYMMSDGIWARVQALQGDHRER